MVRKPFAAALMCAAAFFINDAQAQNLVIQGGTLIDGTGRAPIENSVIVIENGRFKAIGRRGEVHRARRRAGGRRDRQGTSCRASSTATAIGRHSGPRSICTSASPPACRSRRTRTARGAWRRRDGTAAGQIRGPRIWRRPAWRSAPARACSTPKARAPGAAMSGAGCRCRARGRAQKEAGRLRRPQAQRVPDARAGQGHCRRGAQPGHGRDRPFLGRRSAMPRPASTPSSTSGRSAIPRSSIWTGAHKLASPARRARSMPKWPARNTRSRATTP